MAYEISNKLNVSPQYFPPVVVHVSAGDQNIPVKFLMFDKNKEFSVPSGASVVVHGFRKDGGNWMADGSFLGNEVYVTLPKAAMAIEGAGIADVVIKSGNMTVGTANFCLLVERATFPNGVTYSNDSSVYQDLLNFVQSGIDSIPDHMIDALFLEV